MVLLQHGLQSGEGGQVEMIARFVQQQQLHRGVAIQHPGQQCLEPFATTEQTTGQVNPLSIQA
ncbi:hypothetical protein D3C77_346220 [compost metagenome]